MKMSGDRGEMFIVHCSMFICPFQEEVPLPQMTYEH
jgi:hypothetical protein